MCALADEALADDVWNSTTLPYKRVPDFVSISDGSLH